MSELFKVLASGLKPKPAPPATSQVLACPAGYTGSGEHQTRTVTWNVATQSWDTSGWSTTSYDCQIDQFTFFGPMLAYDGVGWYDESVGTDPIIKYRTYDQTLTANGHTARVRARFRWADKTIQYEVWAPTLAGRLCRAHWTEESYKGPEWTWHDFQVLDGSGYAHFLPHSEPEYGYGPAKNIKIGEHNAVNIDIR